MEGNFSNRVRDVISYSREEAIRLGHDYIGTEHLLLGIIREGEGIAVKILRNLGCDLFKLKKAIEDTVRSTGGTLTVSESAGQTYTAEPQGEGYHSITRTKLEAFLDAVQGERDVAVPGEFGLRVTALTEAAYRSVEEGRPIDAWGLVEDARDGR